MDRRPSLRTTTRRLMPACSLPAQPVQPAQPVLRRKRQTVSLACERCRKRKAKCNGLMPSCYACTAANLECKYLAPEAGRLLRYRDMQSAYDDMRHASVAAVGSADTVQPFVRANEPMGRWLEALRRSRERRLVPVVSPAASPKVLPVSLWTSVSDDNMMLTGLLTLFWTWAPTASRLVHREMFLAGLCAAAGSTAVTAHFGCSKLLVNAILALSSACFTGPSTSEGPRRLCHRFAHEARRLVENKASSREDLVPLFQGVAILSVYEGIFGYTEGTTASLLSTYYELRAAHQRAQPFIVAPTAEKVQAMCYMATGFDFFDFQLGLIFSSPALACSAPSMSDPEDGTRLLGAEAALCDSLWSPYPLSDQPRLSFSKEHMRAEWELVRHAKEIVPVIESNRTSSVPDFAGTKALYARLLAWHESRMLDFQGQCSLIPAWVCLSLTYHVVALRLLEPFNGISFLDFDGFKPARSLSQSHSESIVSALWRYRTAYDLWHDFWPLHACYAAVSNLLLGHGLAGGSSHKEALTQGCQLLCDLGTRLPLASRMCQELQLAHKELDLPDVVLRFLRRGAAMTKVSQIANVAMLSDAGGGGVRLEPCVIRFGETIHRIG
ncbi:hypothetical protein XA68_18415 [Ophiocordyceps unilateralis]|uniref:Zn(2)-C6 fungal-type domain-containing protein n=1 Tax=Ophiocordyceps unilateralis TaxID=268505 RepID=A0A2A9PJC3_OPHUN|nr:hypothetical protein XA68_18415 [Ophiocordyceps unilateralis]